MSPTLLHNPSMHYTSSLAKSLYGKPHLVFNQWQLYCLNVLEVVVSHKRSTTALLPHLLQTI